MKFLVVSLLSVGLLFAAAYEGTTEDLGIEIEARSTVTSELLDYPDGRHDVTTPEPLDIETLADINDPSSSTFTYLSPVERAISIRDEGPLVRPEYDWADDIEVYPGAVGSGQDFDLDVDTGDIYAIFDTDHATGDSLVAYRSQDGGETWSFFGLGTNIDNAISNPKIRIVKDASGDPWVILMGIWHESGDDNLWTRRYTTGGTSATWEQVATGVEFADMDGDIGSGAYAYATWVPEGTFDIYAGRNAIDGSGWVNPMSLFVNTEVTSSPAIAAGAGGTVGVAFVDDRITSDPQVRIKRSTTFGATWLGSAQVSNAAAPTLENCDIAFNHASTQTGWITVTYLYTDDNFGYYYTQDSGASWTYGTILAGAGDDENLGSIRTLKNTTSGAITVAFNSDPGDDVMFSWASGGTPNSFSTPEIINEYATTGYWPATAGWIGGNYSAILYSNWNTNYRLMFDWYNNTGIDETSAGPSSIRNAPNPFSATTIINFNLTQSSPVTITIYNIAGQLVSTLADNQSYNEGSNSVQWDGQNESGTIVSPGVYFCRLNANGISQTHRMLMVR